MRAAELRVHRGAPVHAAMLGANRGGLDPFTAAGNCNLVIFYGDVVR